MRNSPSGKGREQSYPAQIFAAIIILAYLCPRAKEFVQLRLFECLLWAGLSPIVSGPHGEAKSESIPGASGDTFRKLVGCHHVDRFRAEESPSVGLAIIEEHLAEAEMVRGCRNQSNRSPPAVRLTSPAELHDAGLQGS
jgi:hypothetical protein